MTPRGKKLLENYVRKTVRKVMSELRSTKFNPFFHIAGEVKFNNEGKITNRFLEKNYKGTIRGDMGNIISFYLDEDGTFSGVFWSNIQGLDDYSNAEITKMVRDIILAHDEDASNIIDTIVKINANKEYSA